MRRQQILRERRRNRANATAFFSLIATPETGAVTLPAGARISLAYAEGTDPEILAGSSVGPSNRDFYTRALAEGEVTLPAGRVVIDWLERGTVVTPETGFTVQVDVGYGVWRTISEA